MQLAVYALAYKEMNGRLPDYLELRFVMSGTSTPVRVTEGEVRKTREKIAAIAASIREADFTAKPSAFACRRCRCRPICKESAV
jgi:CRISPR/Cas system-associated exonuclease Cas4 (RecB family)